MPPTAVFPCKHKFHKKCIEKLLLTLDYTEIGAKVAAITNKLERCKTLPKKSDTCALILNAFFNINKN